VCNVSTINDLLIETCPDGVLYVPLNTVWIRGPKSKAGARKVQAMVEGNIPCFTSGRDTHKVTDYLVDGAYVFINDGGSADFKYNKGKAFYTDHVIAISTKDNVDTKYLYYYLQQMREYIDENLFRGSGIKNLSITELGNLIIPLPPLPVQAEIVRILDTFTELIAELTAELAARKKQYEIYREELLGFEGSADVEWKKLGEVCNVHAGGTPSKSKREYWEGGSIKWLNSSVCKNRKTVEEVSDYITPLGHEKSSARLMEKGTTLIAMVGATIGKLAYLPYKATINQNVAGVYPKDTNEVCPDYVYYACSLLYKHFMQLGQGGIAMANLTFIRGLEIPIPSIVEQERIVSILDQFDTLTNSLTEGIPAEIELRQKQYEFYREKLLTF